MSPAVQALVPGRVEAAWFAFCADRWQVANDPRLCTRLRLPLLHDALRRTGHAMRPGVVLAQSVGGPLANAVWAAILERNGHSYGELADIFTASVAGMPAQTIDAALVAMRDGYLPDGSCTHVVQSSLTTDLARLALRVVLHDLGRWALVERAGGPRDLVVAAEALVVDRAVVLARAGAVVASLAVGPAEALVVGWAMVLAPVMVAVVAAKALRWCTPTRRTRTLLTTW
jgi:hypothetical protein